ncbi:MAG: ABC transporter ATP-binding protein [Bacteroidota bacterium]|nr:ABC transporter ATP-binding protein [Bacteroidota bacterium]
MVELKNIDFSYSARQPLFEDLSLRLEAGKIYGLLGKNGAGKTTLLKNVAGLSYIKAGTCQVFGLDSKKRDPAMLEKCFFLPEEIWLPDTTVSTYLKMYAPSWPQFNYDFFRYCLQEFEIRPEARLKSMSFGQRKKTAISFALATQTSLLMMDEPTNGLDIPSKSKFRKLVAEITDENRCIVLSTHQVRDLETLIDTIIILESSKILLNNTTDEICEKLLFKTVTSLDQVEPILYSEFTPRGFSVVTTNPAGEDSKIDLEALFNVSIQQPDLIQQLFHA